MPRKAFISDLQKAVAGVQVVGIADVHPGGDDGEFTFQCLADGESFQISALVPDVSEYPSNHTYMIFAPDDAPASVASALADIADSATGKSIIQMLELASRNLESTDRDGDQQMLDSQEDFEDLDDESDDDEVDEYFPDDDMAPKPVLGKQDTASSIEGYIKPTSEFRHRIRSDLMTAKAHGFKVGHLGGLLDGLGCYISLSTRLSKLGISEEAMQAWQVEASEYLVVIFHYPNGYKSMDSLKSYDAPTARRNFGVRVGISSTYKPTMQEAIRAFTVLNKEDEKRRGKESQAESQSTLHKGFRNSFISRPLNELLDERFPTLLHYRYNGMPWSGAEQFYNDHYGSRHAHSDLGLSDQYLEPENASATYPALVSADHIHESPTQEHSLPLIGMQFVLRHFVRCTEFCLICFTKMPDDLQAIKPYVCDKPLCLYQYMSLGFGPSIEHEILSQPKVVDLLISFCYSSARLGRLKDFPTGLSLMVPPSGSYEQDYINQQQQHYSAWNAQPAVAPPVSTTIGAEQVQMVRYNAVAQEILFEDKKEKCPFRAGDWIILRTTDDPGWPMHCRVSDTSLYPTVHVAEPVIPASINQGLANPAQYSTYGNQYNPTPSLAAQTLPQPVAPVAINEFRPAKFYTYNQNFDEMDDFHKREAIYALLDILPNVNDMKQYLARKAQSPLSSWIDRLPPAVLGILRWIIASNRACIMQAEEEDESGLSKKGEERLYGMAGWTQFRFAMGAPDKERRFIHAVRETTERLKLKYPTLFAWHGSPLVNWHSIIREGLHFNDTAHGRAYGHGVYHSLDFNTSMGYCGYGPASHTWPVSDLKVGSALALNEIVNAPKEYVSASPHLVVAQLDWIQTRYLFVKTNTNNYTTVPTSTKEVKPLQSIDQDPNMRPKGCSDSLIIPIHAVSGSRRPQSRSVKAANKRRKATGSSAYDPIDLDADDDDDGASIATLDEDLTIFEDEDIYMPQPDTDPLPTPNSTKGKSKASGFLSKLVGSKSSKPLTDYVPGTLDYSTLPMLQPPAWATSSATKRLQRDFKELLKVQEKEPTHELGWHIDADKIENMYQWIVELHSFDQTLPLAKDMKAKGHKSIVLELRFGKDYPMSPPFVRVIRPRFLGFQQGGGGHVTAGGALCMELLTNNGWSAVSSIESVLLQVRMAMSSLDPKPARLDNHGRQDYGVGEAVEAYIRSCNVHGWTVPAGFREMAYGGDQDTSHGYY
ncbi:uncharacterized protein BDR25DRAFT_84254 [Lindgomyces ingoldianus]|uniref:Uncharacterized protein n=1 Tax=Lindgomyces ingoldianus TaxID=673940 RepID=A0ACB6QEY6_9PLEO|nr:uncharacterized protein BDR25DRAFT_84254 [Lindgomyces ingoldianus]KAF2465474.1 hypothetical protein BDR25DRAFT_84254 [Lindgomyces ingoldianus]